jgi:hypothetical protein
MGSRHRILFRQTVAGTQLTLRSFVQEVGQVSGEPQAVGRSPRRASVRVQALSTRSNPLASIRLILDLSENDWLGGATPHKKLLYRVGRYGSGYLPMGPMSDDERGRLVSALREAGKNFSEFEFVSGMAGRFSDATSCADLNAALSPLAPQIRHGVRTFVIKPSQFISDMAQFRELADEVLEKANRIAARINWEEA